MPTLARHLYRPFVLACAVLCAPACGTDPLPGSLEQANIVPGPNGYRWDAHWDRVLPDGVMANAAQRPASAPAMVAFGGRRHYFYATASGQLGHYVEGDWFVIVDNEYLKGAPAAVVANGNIEIFYRSNDTSPTIEHSRWNGAYRLLPNGRYQETLGWGATTAPGASVVTVQVPVIVLGSTIYQNVTRVDVYYNNVWAGITNVHRVNNGPWTAPEPLWGGYAASAPAAVSWGNNRLDLFWRAGDKTVQHKWFDGNVACATTNGCWSAGAETMMTNIESAPTVSSWGPSRLDIFAVGGDGKLKHVYYAGYGWRGPFGDPAVDCVASINTASEHASAGASAYGTSPIGIDLAIWGTDGNFWHDSYGYGPLDTPPNAPTCGCGVRDAACCDSGACGPGLTCSPGNVCAPCGAVGQACCAASSCDAGLACNGTTCVKPPSKWDLLYDNLLSSYCAGCHRSGTNQFLVLGNKDASYDKLIGYVGHENGALVVVPGNPDSSYIYQKVTGAPGISGVRMPKDSPPLDDAQIALVHDWIAAGATK
jgi:hypothetical protein